MAKYAGSEKEAADLMKEYPDGGMFAVYGGDLGFSVIVFCLCALTCIFTLMIRRRVGWGELGGPTTPKYVTAVFFVFLWFLYIGLSTFKTFQTLADDPCWNK